MPNPFRNSISNLQLHTAPQVNGIFGRSNFQRWTRWGRHKAIPQWSFMPTLRVETLLMKVITYLYEANKLIICAWVTYFLSVLLLPQGPNPTNRTSTNDQSSTPYQPRVLDFESCFCSSLYGPSGHSTTQTVFFVACLALLLHWRGKHSPATNARISSHETRLKDLLFVRAVKPSLFGGGIKIYVY
jgi:hypothetical protein